ncbi:MAG: hypothetical protein KME08_17735 [Aphanothece sp. CMT-3BRIN-NPC111]|nr:hypothetical protein [Aphanothece sp. CMT-3BRIN-NPC111]
MKLALRTVGHTGTYAGGDLLFGERLKQSCSLTASRCHLGITRALSRESVN